MHAQKLSLMRRFTFSSRNAQKMLGYTVSCLPGKRIHAVGVTESYSRTITSPPFLVAVHGWRRERQGSSESRRLLADMKPLTYCWLGLLLLLTWNGTLLVESRKLDGQQRGRADGGGDAVTVKPRRRRFIPEELLSIRFPTLITGDLDLDVCKAGSYGFWMRIVRRFEFGNWNDMC